MGPQTAAALSGTKRYSNPVNFSGAPGFPGKNKIPLQNNGTLAYYKNIICSI